MSFVVDACLFHVQGKTQGYDTAPEFPKPEPVASAHQATAYAG